MSDAPWNAPELTGLNRLPMHAVRHTPQLVLDGSWRFQLLARPDAPLSEQWRTIDVPGCWTRQGTSDLPQYTNVVMPFSDRPPSPPVDNPTGVYARDFDVPTTFAERRSVLHVGAAESVLIVRVNDHDVGVSKDSHLAAEFDVTDLIRPGATNTINLRVVKWSDATYVEDQDQWWHGGITRSVFLYTTPKVYLADVHASAGLANDYTTGVLDLRVEVGFGAGPQPDWVVEAALDDISLRSDVPCGEEQRRAGRVSPSERERRAPRPDGRVVLRAEVPGVRRWSAEQPHLYDLRVGLRSPSGELVDQTTVRIGFKRVEVRGLELLVNGQPIYLRGVNRHDFDQHTGRVVTAEAMRADVVLMKRFGFNALRTSHYPNDPRLLDACDQLGLYVVDEANIESHAFITSLCDDPRYLNAWVDRVSRMARRDKNHASIILWSLGNESGYGANHDAAAGWLRRYDPSRPLHYEGAIRWDWASNQTVSDVTCPMYPPIASIVEHARSGKQRHPLIMCEYSHAMGNSNGTLAEYWDAIETTAGLQGGFIWEFWDHGLVQALPDGRQRWAYGGDFGDVPNDGNFCLDGLTWPNRQAKPALWEHLQLAAPVRMTAHPTGLQRGQVVLHNRQAFRGLDWLRARYEVSVEGRLVQAGDVPLPTLAPGAETVIEVPNWAPANWPVEGERWLTLLFTTAAECEWAPAEFEVCWAQLSLDGREAPLPLPLPGGSGAGIALDDAGRFVHDLFAEPPRLCLWRAPTDNDRIGGAAERWSAWGLADLERQLIEVQREGATALVRTEYRTRAGVRIPHQQRLSPLVDGGVLVEESIVLPEALFDVARVGTVLELIDGFEQVEWFGRGPHESYPDRRRGARVGHWSATVDELYVPYIRPQENGGRADVRWLELHADGSRAVRLVFDRPRQASVSHFRAADLAAARHDVELMPRAQTVIHIDALHRGLGTASCGPDTLPEYLVPIGTHRWSWAVSPGARVR